MNNNSGGWIKIYRSIQNWEWVNDDFIFRFFVLLLTMVNYEDKEVKGMVIKRGQMLSSIADLANKFQVTPMKIRYTLNKLESTGEITKSTTNKFTILTICNYDDYQGAESELQQTNNKQNNKQKTRFTTSRTTNKKHRERQDVETFSENENSFYNKQNNKQKTRFTTSRTTNKTTNKKNDLQEAERHVGHFLKNIRRKKKYHYSKQKRAREREIIAEKTSEEKIEESRQLLNNLDTKEKEKEKSCAKKEKEKEMETPEVLSYDELKQVNADRIGQMMGNLNWLRDMMISNNRTMEQMKGYLHRFGEHCNAGNTTLTTKDMYSYFRNWLRYQLKEEEQKKRMERKQQSQPSGQRVSKANQFRLSEINATWDDFKMPELTEEDKKLLEHLNRPR